MAGSAPAPIRRARPGGHDRLALRPASRSLPVSARGHLRPVDRARAPGYGMAGANRLAALAASRLGAVRKRLADRMRPPILASDHSVVRGFTRAQPTGTRGRMRGGEYLRSPLAGTQLSAMFKRARREATS